MKYIAILTIAVVLVALFWGALTDALKLWACCLLLAGSGLLAYHLLDASLTPEQRAQVQQRQEVERLIAEEVKKELHK